MKTDYDFNYQFQLDRKYYLENLNFSYWYRYFFVVREVIDLQPQAVLEIGAGNNILKNCLSPLVSKYQVLDLNEKLEPDILADAREFKPELKEKFDCAIACDVLEHIPFPDVTKACANIFAYLTSGGKAIITIPHRRSHFLAMTPLDKKPRTITVPTGFLSPGAFYRRFIKRKIWIDPYHCWEIGDGKVKRTDVESHFMQAGFQIEKREKLLYVDFWVLSKNLMKTRERYK
jgi:SAM-dependent methyltransferase